DVHLDFHRIHVDNRANASARESAAGRQRRDYFTRLRGLDGNDAGKGSPDDHVFVVTLSQDELRARDGDRTFLDRNVRPGRVVGRLVIVECLTADQSGRMLQLTAMIETVRIVSGCPGSVLVFLRQGETRPRFVQRSAGIRGIESRDDLVTLDALTLFN